MINCVLIDHFSSGTTYMGSFQKFFQRIHGYFQSIDEEHFPNLLKNALI